LKQKYILKEMKKKKQTVFSTKTASKLNRDKPSSNIYSCSDSIFIKKLIG
jgi:hypothetical protein